MKVINKTKSTLIGNNITLANNPIKRIVGLLNRSSLSKDEGLLLKNANSIHSIGMRFNFDAVFLDKNYKVVHIEEDIAPFRVLPIIFKASLVLELPTGVVKDAKIEIDDYLEFD